MRLVDIGGPDLNTNAAYLVPGNRKPGTPTEQSERLWRSFHAVWHTIAVWMLRFFERDFFLGVELGDKVGGFCFLKVRLWGQRGPFNAGRSWIQRI